jgi:hypothetical protein
VNLNIEVTNPQGETETYTEQEVMQNLASQGVPIQGVSPDGMTLIGLDDAGQHQSVGISDVLQKFGYTVNDIKPSNPAENMVNPEWRMAIESLGDEDAKKSFLESKLRREGIENPKIYGKGSDFFTFDPRSAQWHALTNKQGMDMSDVAGLIPGGLRMAGGIVGAGAGLMGGLGAGSIPMAMAGGALGQGGAEAAMKAGFSMDPDYAATQTMGGVAGDIGGQALAGGAGAGIGGAAMKYGSPMIKALANTGPVSTVGRALGGIGSAIGGGLRQAERFLGGGPIRQDITSAMLVPGAGTAQAAGLVAQAPDYLLKNIPRALQGIGKSEFGQAALSPTGAKALSEEAGALLRPRVLSNPALEFNKMLRGGANEVTSREVGGNIGQRLAQARTFTPGGFSGGLSPQAQASSEEMAAALQAGLKRQGDWGHAGEVIGQGVHNLGQAGLAVEKGVRGIGRGVTGAAELSGRTIQNAGQTVRNASLLSQPLENTAYLQQALGLAEENMSRRYRKPLPFMPDSEKIIASTY